VRALKKLFSPPPFTHEAHEAYIRLVAQARKPVFYTQAGVPDALDGRFDVIILHVFLLIHRLRKEAGNQAPEFIRVLSEVFFSDMDRSLREMGSSDTGISKRIKKMVQAFYGRLHGYELAVADPELLHDALARNLYRNTDTPIEHLNFMADYVGKNITHLATQPTEEILHGLVEFSAL
jgi:cytochrome b pre-mRNA-processing protein 3